MALLRLGPKSVAPSTQLSPSLTPASWNHVHKLPSSATFGFCFGWMSSLIFWPTLFQPLHSSHVHDAPSHCPHVYFFHFGLQICDNFGVVAFLVATSFTSCFRCSSRKPQMSSPVCLAFSVQSICDTGSIVPDCPKQPHSPPSTAFLCLVDLHHFLALLQLGLACPFFPSAQFR